MLKIYPILLLLVGGLALPQHNIIRNEGCNIHRSDTLRPLNFRWIIRAKHLPEWFVQSMSQEALEDFKSHLRPESDTIIIQPTEDRLRNKGFVQATHFDSSNDSVIGRLWFSMELGDYQLGEAIVFNLTCKLKYNLLDNGLYACKQMDIAVANYDTTVIDIDITEQKLMYDGRLYSPSTTFKEVMEGRFTVQGLIRMARLSKDSCIPDTTVYRYNYSISGKQTKGSIQIQQDDRP